MIYLSKENMQKVFSMSDAFDAVSKAFEVYSLGKANVPLRTGIRVEEVGGDALIMPAFAAGALGVKIVSVFPNNAIIGRATTPSVMMVMSEETGEVVAVMDGTYLTQVRTAAGAGLATKYLARKDATIGALIGLGGQAHCQILGMLMGASGIKEVRVFDVDPGRRVAFAKEHSKLVDIVPVMSGDEAVDGADVITAVTTAKKEVFSASSVKPGAHVNGIGSFTHETKELPEGLVANCDLLVFDTADGVLSEAGDIITPLNKGLLSGKDLTIEMGHVILGRYKRESPEDITVYKAVGSGVMDVVTAKMIYLKAMEMSIGTEIM